jgi:uncharacterized protein YacL
MEPACHALEHGVQATSVVEKMKSITKGYRLVNNKELLISAIGAFIAVVMAEFFSSVILQSANSPLIIPSG